MLSNIKISKHYYENMMNALENNKKALKEEYLKAFGKGIYFLVLCLFALLCFINLFSELKLKPLKKKLRKD